MAVVTEMDAPQPEEAPSAAWSSEVMADLHDQYREQVDRAIAVLPSNYVVPRPDNPAAIFRAKRDLAFAAYGSLRMQGLDHDPAVQLGVDIGDWIVDRFAQRYYTYEPGHA